MIVLGEVECIQGKLCCQASTSKLFGHFGMKQSDHVTFYIVRNCCKLITYPDLKTVISFIVDHPGIFDILIHIVCATNLLLNTICNRAGFVIKKYMAVTNETGGAIPFFHAPA